MSLNKIMNKIKEWNNKKNKTDIEYASTLEASFYEKTSDISQVLNEVSYSNQGNGIQY